MSDDKRPTEPPKGITRIPLKQITFWESENIPGQGFGNIADCGDPGNGRPHLIAAFIPSFQAVQIEFKTAIVSERETFMVPCSNVKRMVLE